MAAVSFEHVTKVFSAKAGPVHAVDDLCLEVGDREFVVLVGPSGCGKTTTLRLVAGLEEPDSGLIRIGRRTVNHVAPKDRDVAMVFQNYALYPHMTVFGNMAFGLKMRRVPKGEIKHKVAKTAAMLGIEHLLDRKPAALSGGERQRVAVGRAIVRRPRVFLFDEPLSNLDAKLRTRMRTEVKSLHRELNTTIIYVTHDQEEAMTLGDRLVIMDRGVAQQCGTPLEVYDHPASLFVAGFVGTPPMNLLKGRLDTERGGANVGFALPGDKARLSLPPEFNSRMRPHIGRTVALGIRPQHLWVTRGGAAPIECGRLQQPGDYVASVTASVTLAEPLGDSINVHLIMPGGTPVVARVAPTVTVYPGQQVGLAVDMSRVHFFSADGRGVRLA